jgi:hypothetical protein
MTGPLVIAIAESHLNDLRATAAKSRQPRSKPRGKQRTSVLPGLLRPRRALAA